MESEVYFENIKHQIRQELKIAEDSVNIAVAWFTDDDLFDDLVILSKKGVCIQLVLNEDEINKNSGLEYPILFRNGGMVYFIDAREILMHNKFCVIDEKTVLNGSFNWTRKASSNLENLTIFRDKNVSNRFTEQFKSLKNRATSYFEEIDETHPNFLRDTNNENLDWEELFTRAKKRKKNGNYLASLIDFKKVIEIIPSKEEDILFDMAYCQSELDDNKSALESYSKYLKLNPQSTASLNNRGLIYRDTKETKLAYYDFTKAIEIEPNESLYYSNRAELTEKFVNIYTSDSIRPAFMPNINSSEDMKLFNEFLKERSFWDKPNLKKIIEQGINDYLTVVKLDKNCDKWNIYSDIGEIYYDLNNYSKSVEYFTKAISFKTDYDYAYYRRGLSNYIWDNFDQAISDLESALRIKPNYNIYTELLQKVKKEKRKPKNWFK